MSSTNNPDPPLVLDCHAQRDIFKALIESQDGGFLYVSAPEGSNPAALIQHVRFEWERQNASPVPLLDLAHSGTRYVNGMVAKIRDKWGLTVTSPPASAAYTIGTDICAGGDVNVGVTINSYVQHTPEAGEFYAAMREASHRRLCMIWHLQKSAQDPIPEASLHWLSDLWSECLSDIPSVTVICFCEGWPPPDSFPRDKPRISLPTHFQGVDEEAAIQDADAYLRRLFPNAPPEVIHAIASALSTATHGEPAALHTGVILQKMNRALLGG